MSNSPIDQVREEIHQLRGLVLYLSAALLRKIALDTALRRPPSRDDAERLVGEAEECFRTAKAPGLNRKIAEGLEAAGHDLMARAVEIDTIVQGRNSGTPPS